MKPTQPAQTTRAVYRIRRPRRRTVDITRNERGHLVAHQYAADSTLMLMDVDDLHYFVAQYEDKIAVEAWIGDHFGVPGVRFLPNEASLALKYARLLAHEHQVPFDPSEAERIEFFGEHEEQRNA